MDARELHDDDLAMIPIYMVSATGGRVYSCDDSHTLNDFAALDGTGGTSFAPFLLTTLLPLPRTLGWSDLRKLRQRFDTSGAATITVTPWRDGSQTTQAIQRSFAAGSVGITATPLFAPASDTQLQITVSGYAAPVQLSNAEIVVVERRHSRATGAGVVDGPSFDDTTWTWDSTEVTLDQTTWGLA